MPLRHTQVYEARWNPPKDTEELVEVLIKPLSTIYQQPWLAEEIPVDWKLANVHPSTRSVERRI